MHIAHLSVPSIASGGMISKSTRRMSFDDGSDLSALTSEAEEQQYDENRRDEPDEDDKEEQGALEVNEDDDDHDRKDEDQGDDAQLLDLGGIISRSLSHQLFPNEHPPYAEHGETEHAIRRSSSMRASFSSSASSSSSSSSTASSGSMLRMSRHHSKRGRGRPPRKQNALAAAAKRQASRHASLSLSRAAAASHANGEYVRERIVPKAETPATEDDHVELRTHMASSHAQYNRSPRVHHRISPASQHIEATSNEEDEDHDGETNEAAQRSRPLPPAMIDSSDEDYEELAKGNEHSASARKKTLALNTRTRRGPTLLKNPSSKGRAPSGKTNGHTRSTPPSINSLDRGMDRKKLVGAEDSSVEEMGDHPMTVEFDQTAGRITGLAINGLPPLTRKDWDTRIVVTDTSKGAIAGKDVVVPVHELVNAASSMDTEDAMSGISDDVPILLKATARAAAAAANANGGTSYPTDMQSTVAKEILDGFDHSDFSPFKSSLHVPSPYASSRRGRSPASTGRGRGRGGGRGRGRKVHAPKFVEHDDIDASAASANEDGLLYRERDRSPNAESPAASDHDEGAAAL